MVMISTLAEMVISEEKIKPTLMLLFNNPSVSHHHLTASSKPLVVSTMDSTRLTTTNLRFLFTTRTPTNMSSLHTCNRIPLLFL